MLTLKKKGEMTPHICFLFADLVVPNMKLGLLGNWEHSYNGLRS